MKKANGCSTKPHPLKNGNEKNPWNRGVFCRIRSADIGDDHGRAVHQHQQDR